MKGVRIVFFLWLLILCSSTLFAQHKTDTIGLPKKDTVSPIVDSLIIPIQPEDTALRITNLNPYITLHVDSTLTYKLDINKDASKYFWFLRNAPVGLKINKDNGTLSFKAEKTFFLSGKLKYDYNYTVSIGVQNLANPKERIDTMFTLVFYNTEIIPSNVKPSVSSVLYVDEGDTVSFQIQCENGSFPIEHLSYYANYPIKSLTPVKQCDDVFTWSPTFDFVKETDSAKMKIVTLTFIGATKFMTKDTATVKIVVKDALNYPITLQEYNQTRQSIESYILKLQFMFMQLDKNVKTTKNTRTTFDITSAATTTTGTILVSSAATKDQTAGKILPSVGVTLVPVKEAVAPVSVYTQNQTTSIRNAVKRLEFNLQDNILVGERDPDISKKIAKLRDELQQTQRQLSDLPLEMVSGISEKELKEYFNSPKVAKKYRVKK